MSPCNYKEYPENWKWLSKQIIADAGDRCELCYAPNHTMVSRCKTGMFPWSPLPDKKDIEYMDKRSERLTKIILTVHHIDSDKTNSKKQNLIALCQRCHCRLDLYKHMANRKKSKAEKGFL